MIHKVDPWFIERILTEYAQQHLLKARLGATGETMYGISEQFVIQNWHLFTDEFRNKYRHEWYEE
jgi:hypothetical protein